MPARGGRPVAGPRVETLGELLLGAYANLGMAHAAVCRGLAAYDTGTYMIRAKLLKGLRTGTMEIGSLFADAREMPNDRCAYCAATPPPKLHADHLIPRDRGGLESSDNLVWACRSCNSSKNARDLLEWYARRGGFPPLAVLRRYLKLAIGEARSRGLMDAPLAIAPEVTFSIEHVPRSFPPPSELRWLA